MAVQMLFRNEIEQIMRDGFLNQLEEERKAEIEHIGKRWDFYNGDTLRYINQYPEETKQEWLLKEKIRWNYTALIVNKYIEQVFGKPVKIDFEDSKDQEIWKKIADPVTFQDISPLMVKVQRIAEISDTCMVVVRHDTKQKRTYFEAVRGEYIRFFPDLENPKEIGKFIINYKFPTGTEDGWARRIEIWDKEYFSVQIRSEKTKKLLVPAQQDRNPYGFLPIVLFQPSKDDNSFYGNTNIHGIVDINEAYNNLWTNFGRILDMQAFSVMVVTSSDEIPIDVAPTRFIKFEIGDERGQGDAKYITPNAKISEYLKALDTMKSELGNISSIPTTVIQSGSSSAPQSGYSLQIKSQPLVSLKEQRQLSYGPSMINLAKMAVYIDKFYSGSANKSINDYKVNIEFYKSPEIFSPSEIVTLNQFKIDNHVLTSIDLIMQDNPEMDRKQAEERYLENKKINSDEIEEIDIDDILEEELGKEPGE